MSMLLPQVETLHDALTLDPIDLSGPEFKGKSFNRNKLLIFLASVLHGNPNVHSFFFRKQGTTVKLYKVYPSGEIDQIVFTLMSQQPDWNQPRLSVREYLTRMLAQHVYTIRVDYLGNPDFIYY